MTVLMMMIIFFHEINMCRIKVRTYFIPRGLRQRLYNVFIIHLVFIAYDEMQDLKYLTKF